MAEWININLPWMTNVLDESLKPNYPQMPDLSKRIKKEFGTTAGREWSKITHREKSRYETASSQFTRTLKEPISSEEFLEKISEAHPDNPSVQKVVAYHQLRRRIEAWQEQQPEIIAWKNALEEWDRDEKQKSFCGRELNVPGTLVDIQQGDEVKTYLIGDINTYAGVCDDCTGFDTRMARVIRYKVVWTPA